MSVELRIPEIGESVTEINIGEWHKSEGDNVEQDEPLVELESEKATLDLRAPAAGILSKILKQSGDTAEVGEVIGQIDEQGGQKPSEQAQESPPADKKMPKQQERPADAEKFDTAAKRVAPKAPPAEEEQSLAKAKSAEEKADVPTEEPTEKRAKAKPELTAEPSRGELRVPMSPVRRRIAARLVEAQQKAALLTTFNEIDMSAVNALRAQHGEAFQRRHQVRLGFMSFFVKATIEALGQFRELNAIIEDDEIVYRRYYDLGVAISSDKGLVVPVLRNADRMSFAQIEKAIDDFASRARGGSLKVNELQGGTFTITNGGVFGSLLSTPIVNPPQSGVLGMHAIQNRPVALDSQIIIRPMMYVALTYDHRIVDGREAVKFLRRIKETIEEPSRMLIEV